MMAVVDTNVPVVANGCSEQASNACVLSCVQKIREITQKGNRLLLDSSWHIITEYQQNLRSSGQPGVGDGFLRWVLTNRANPERCSLVHITSCDDLVFEEFPNDPELGNFDRDDRKFVAVALAYYNAHSTNPTVLVAVDRGWWNYRQSLARNKVIVEFLCPEDIQELANDT